MPTNHGDISNESKIAAAREQDGGTLIPLTDIACMAYAIFLHVEAGYSSATAKLLQEYNDVKEQILQIISVAEARAYVHLIYHLS